MLSRTRSRSSGLPAFCGSNCRRCSRSFSATPGRSMDRTVFPSYAELAVACQGPIFDVDAPSAAAHAAILRGTAIDHSKISAVRNVAYRLGKGVLDVGQCLLRWRAANQNGPLPSLLATQPLIIIGLHLWTGDLF